MNNRHRHPVLPPTMTGAQFKAIREARGMSRVQFGNAIGYGGNYNSVDNAVKRYENGERDIPNWIATAARALDHDGLLEFLSRNGGYENADFVRRLSSYLTQGYTVKGETK